MIELRWLHDPTGLEVTKLQWRINFTPKGFINQWSEWHDVPHFWPDEQHAEGIAVKVSSPLAKE